MGNRPRDSAPGPARQGAPADLPAAASTSSSPALAGPTGTPPGTTGTSGTPGTTSTASRPWPAEALAGLSGAATSLATALTVGLLAYAPAGPAAAALGLPAAFAAALAGGTVMALLGRSRLPCATPSSATTLLLAALVARLCTEPALQPATPGGAAALVALCALAVVLSGLLQVLMGAAGLGALARLVPQPVIAGFMNGVAVLVALAQVPLLAGLAYEVWRAQGWPALAQGQPLALATGLLAAAVVWGLTRRLPRWPLALLGLAAGWALVAAFTAFGGAEAPPRVGELPTALPLPVALWPLWSMWSGPTAAAWPAVLQTAVLLALLGALESALAARALDQLMGDRHEPNRELRALGWANVASGLFGGLPVVYHRLRALATHRAGGRSWRSALLGAWLLVLAYHFGQVLVEPLPLAALAGIMLTSAWTLVDTWTRELALQRWRGDRSRELQLGLAVVAVVAVVTVGWGFAPAVGLGVLLSLGLLVRGMNRTLLRARYSAAQRPSRRAYPAVREHFLAPRRAQIEVLELEGTLFFGSAERLLREALQHAPGVRWLVLDLRRIGLIDASGAVALAQLARQLQQAGVQLWLAGAGSAEGGGHLATLQRFGAFVAARPGRELHADADHAIEAAEAALLREGGLGLEALTVALPDCELFASLATPQLQRVLQAVQTRSLAAGEALQWPAAGRQRLVLLAAGSVTVLGPPAADGRRRRLLSLSPGMTLAEAAAGADTGTEVRADQPSLLYELDAEALAALQRDDPALVLQLWQQLAAHLLQRLRGTAQAWADDGG